MRKIKSFLIVLYILDYFYCSNEKVNKDIIIGKWQIIEYYEFNKKVELPCVQYYYTEYKEDNNIDSRIISFDKTPDDCKLMISDFGWKWSNLGYNLYLIKNISDKTGITYKIYKEGDNLVQEEINQKTKTIYKPHN